VGAEHAQGNHAGLDAHEIEEWIAGWDDQVYNDNSPNPDIRLGEMLLLYFEWMSVFKVSDACAQAVYRLLSLLLPDEANAGSWAVSKKLLKQVCEARVRKIETCPNDHIAFMDCKSPKLVHYQHSHRSCCPVCGADRWLTNLAGKVRAAKTVYFLPVGPWLRDLFRDADVAKHLDTDAALQPTGHVTKSTGWFKKVHVLFCNLSCTHCRAHTTTLFDAT
jgi:hypothetical protein